MDNYYLGYCAVCLAVCNDSRMGPQARLTESQPPVDMTLGARQCIFYREQGYDIHAGGGELRMVAVTSIHGTGYCEEHFMSKVPTL